MIAARCPKCGTIGCGGNTAFCDGNVPLKQFNSNYTFELDKIEEENLAKYLNKLKKKYGSYGFLTYEFTPTGIGTVIKVKSSHKNKAKEITNLDSW